MPFKIIGGLNVDRDSMMRMFVVSHDLYQRIICQKLPLSGERIALNGQASTMGLLDSFYRKFWAVTSKRASSKARENHIRSYTHLVIKAYQHGGKLTEGWTDFALKGGNLH